jgi:mannose-1-phosphate guanylyltransferase/mannose-6-phosphate isomerase
VFIPVILSGGAGTRLWPVSRETHPKPFMRLDDGQSLLQKTFQRASSLKEVAEVLTVTNRDYYFKTKDEYDQLGTTTELGYLLEPFGRNTAPAIGLAARYALNKYGANSVLLILPADHLIDQLAGFNRAIENAYALAKENKLVTFGIKPTTPEVGFGYIKVGAENKEHTAYRVDQFVEKPDLATAEKYLESGDYLWNSGMFCFKAELILSLIETFQPDMFRAINECWNASNGHQASTQMLELDSKTFEAVPDLSIDYAVMEKAKEVMVVPGDFSWNDIGSWNAVGELTRADENGNRVMGEALLVDVTNSVVKSEERLVAAVGVDNLIMIDTPDALLVAHRERSQDVKKIVSQLKQKSHEAYKTHRTVMRPWGTYTVLEESDHYKVKRIVVKPGASLSLQMHHHRSEHWIVVKGVATVTNGDDVFTLETNQSTYIPAKNKHRLENPGKIELILIEVQAGDYLGEDDIVRFEDKYGRA